MTTCWKCGRPTPNQNCECDDCDAGTEREAAEAMIQAALEDMDRRGVRLHRLDWSKVVTLEDWQTLCRALLHPALAIPSDHPRFAQLRKFLTP